MKTKIFVACVFVFGMLHLPSYSYGNTRLYQFTRASAERSYEQGSLEEGIRAYNALYQLTMSLSEEDIERLVGDHVLIEWDLMLLATRYSILLTEAGRMEDASDVVRRVLNHPDMTFPLNYLTTREKAAILFYQQAIVENEHRSWPKWYNKNDGEKVRELLDVYLAN